MNGMGSGTMPGLQRALPDDVLIGWLREDGPYGDPTTEGLPLQGCFGRMSFHARAAMRVAAVEDAARLIELAGAEIVQCCGSGRDVEAAALLLQAEGPAPSLLRAWKVAQTAVEFASGIATATAAIVRPLVEAGLRRPVACTRKTVPGARGLAAQAVRAGGGVMHRLGLSESLLVFPEHLAFVAPADRAAALQALRASQPEKKLLVEVCNDEDALACARAGADGLQLERFSPAALRALRERLHAEGLHALLAPAGGVTVDNALDYARAGADLLVTSAPYLAARADVKVVLAPAS